MLTLHDLTDDSWQRRRREIRLIWHMARQFESEPPMSRANIKKGIAAGATVEVDVSRCKDGFAVLHGPLLESETTGAGPIASVTRAELLQLRLRWFPQDEAEAMPMLLEEAISLVVEGRRQASDRGGRDQGVLMLDIKIKPQEATEAVCEEFAKCLSGLPPDALLLSSKHADCLAALGKHCPEVPRAYDPTQFVLEQVPRAYDPTNDALKREKWETTLAHLALVEANWRREVPRARLAQVFLRHDLFLEAREVGVDLAKRCEAAGYCLGIWTLDASQQKTGRILGILLDGTATLPAQIITNGPFEMERLWCSCLVNMQSQKDSCSGVLESKVPVAAFPLQ